MSEIPERNCVDIIEPFVHALDQSGMLRSMQFLGGVGSFALTDPRAEIRTDEKRITVPGDIKLSNFRDEGTLRDIETLVFSPKKDVVDSVQKMGEAIIGNHLIVETFDFRDVTRKSELLAKPMDKSALLSFVSDRYMDPEQIWTPGSDITVERMLFPFSVKIDPDALESWTLEIGDRLEMPVPAPGAIFINYLTRSISGLRGKDKEKVHKMAVNIFGRAPDTIDWIVNGPGQSQFELARIFQTLRRPKFMRSALVVGKTLEVEPIVGDLREHNAFMLRDAATNTQSNVLIIAQLKSRVLHAGESMDFIVGPFQKYVEPRISSILHNR